jgi:hypothetical protein
MFVGHWGKKLLGLREDNQFVVQAQTVTHLVHAKLRNKIRLTEYSLVDSATLVKHHRKQRAFKRRAHRVVHHIEGNN